MAQVQSLLAACGGETVKLFDVSVETGDPCTFQYTPSPGFQVNCARWNHTNLVVASAGEDRKISLWMKNGQAIGVVPQLGGEGDDSIDESILAICFSSKGSRYLGSGGTGKIIRVWDLQRKRCIKWLKGHTDTITGVMYNCKDEHLASISIKGDLILHNLASGTRAVELKDPHDQVLRVMEYSRLSRHLLLTAGDDGSVHLWDTTSRSPKLSWIKQHSAPTTGVCFSPTSDKMIVSGGLDKKLYTYDPGVKKPVYCVPYEAPFSSLAFRDDGNTLAVGTNSGRVVFYDVRGRPQPFTILRAYSSSEAVTSLSWQRSNPIAVKESSCSVESALLGTSSEESAIMPDPLPASGLVTRGRMSTTAAPVKPSTWTSPFPSQDSTVGPASGISGASVPGVTSTRPKSAGGDASTFSTSRSWSNGTISRIQTPRIPNSFISGKDDMEVFSPLVDVQPITPSLSNFWDGGAGGDDFKKEIASLGGDNTLRRVWGSPTASGVRRFPSIDDLKEEPRSSVERRSGSHQDEVQIRNSPSSPSTSTPPSGLSTKLERSPSVTPPEAWGGEAIERGPFRQPATMSRFASNCTAPPSSGAIPSSRLDPHAMPASAAALESVPPPGAPYATTLAQNFGSFSATETPPRLSSDLESPLSISNGSPTILSVGQQTNGPQNGDLEATSMAASRKLSAYEGRDLHTSFSRSLPGSLPSSSGEVLLGSGVVLSPRQRKSGLERRDERAGVSGGVDGKKDFENGFGLRSDSAVVPGTSPAGSNGHVQGSVQRLSLPQEQQQQAAGATSFALQLVQRGLEESLGAVQRAIHEDVQNLHLELLRQFHIQQSEMAAMMDSFIVRQAELVEEIKALRRENQQLRDLY